MNILPDNAAEITRSFLSQLDQKDEHHTNLISDASLQNNTKQNVNDVEDIKTDLSNLKVNSSVNGQDVASKTMEEWLNKDSLIVHPVWIGNVSRSITMNQFRYFIESHLGRAIVSIHITVKDKSNERGYAFLNLPTAEKQILAVTLLDGKILAENKLIVRAKKPSKFRQSLCGNSPISEHFKDFRDNIVPKILANPMINLNVGVISKLLKENNINVDDLPIRVWGVQCTLTPHCHRKYCSFYHSDQEKELGRLISILTTKNSDNMSNNAHQQQSVNNANAMRSRHTLLIQCLPRTISSSKQIEEIFEVFGDIDNIIVNPDHSCYLRMKRSQDARKIVHLNNHNDTGVGIDFAPYGASKMIPKPNLPQRNTGYSQQMRFQQMGTQQMGSQQMRSQQIGSQQMRLQQMRLQQMGSQQMRLQQMRLQQMRSQQMGSQPMTPQQYAEYYQYYQRYQQVQTQQHPSYGYNHPQTYNANYLYQQQQQQQQRQNIGQRGYLSARGQIPFGSTYSEPFRRPSHQDNNLNYEYQQQQTQNNIGQRSYSSARSQLALRHYCSDSAVITKQPQQQQEQYDLYDEDPFKDLAHLNELGYTPATQRKDINNFRICIKNNIMPSNNSITYNGLLRGYYFDTTTRKRKDNDESMLFYPSYCYGKTRKLLLDDDQEINDNNNNNEYYMTVELNSNIKENEFSRKYLNLVILLDSSGSMAHKIDGDMNSNNTKMKCAKNAIQSILKQLTRKDRLSIITFNENALIIQKMQFVNDINMDNLNKNIENYITTDGGTNFKNGYTKSIEIYNKLFNDNEYKLNSINDDYDNRIIVLTDAQLNAGISSADILVDLIKKCAENDGALPGASIIPEPKLHFPLFDDNEFPLSPHSALKDEGITKQHINNDNDNDDDDAKTSDIRNEYIRNRIYTTFIGIGLDFNSSLIEKITTTRGCNYYSVKTTKEFENTINKEFTNMVNPLLFNICLKIKCKDNSCKIEKVYGSSTNDKENDIINNGEIIRINTLFPSKQCQSTGGIKGGIQLIKLLKTNNNDINVELEVIFEDRNGKKYKNIENVTFNEIDENVNFYDNIGIRKAILLCKYGELIKKWIEIDGNNENNNNYYSSLSSLKMSNKYKKIFRNFLKHFKKEMIKCNDDGLQKEIDLMNKLINL